MRDGCDEKIGERSVDMVDERSIQIGSFVLVRVGMNWMSGAFCSIRESGLGAVMGSMHFS